jgi:hypothetical protein
MPDIEKVVGFLQALGRIDLASLLRFSKYHLLEVDVWGDITVPGAKVLSPPVFTEALVGLSESDQRRIAEAIVATAAPPTQGVERIVFEPLKDVDLGPVDQLLPEIIVQRNEMIAVATGGRRINDANDYYRARRRRILSALQALGLTDPNPHTDLWDWYNKWKVEFSSYAERRQYVHTLYQSLIDRLVAAPPPPVPAREPTGWERVDRALQKAQARHAEGRHEEDYQMVGLLCREIIISVGQAVFDPGVHVAPDGVTPSTTDGGRMIEAFLATVAAGGSNESIRRHARASLQLALELQHKRTADFTAATLCLEATSSVVNILAILSGRRDPAGQGDR